MIRPTLNGYKWGERRAVVEIARSMRAVLILDASCQHLATSLRGEQIFTILRRMSLLVRHRNELLEFLGCRQGCSAKMDLDTKIP